MPASTASLQHRFARRRAADTGKHGHAPTSDGEHRSQHVGTLGHVERIALAGGTGNHQAGDPCAEHELDQCRQHFQRERAVVVEWSDEGNDHTREVAVC